ncbi:MAG: XdhC family protein [Thermosynechococcaceae cyanobacterium MS004]|nr:XdhC family protein [Thermosynechococcaceae cyanobacterium MS004]
MTIAFFQQFAQCLHQGQVVLATVVNITGSVPRELGAKMLVNAQGEIWGTIGGGAGEAKVIRHALALMETGQPQWVEIDLSGAAHRSVEGVCGGMMQVWLQCWQGKGAIALIQDIIETLQGGGSCTLVTPYNSDALPYQLEHPTQADHLSAQAFVESFNPAPILLIVGAGHCGIQLAKVADLLDFQVIVQDDRPEWANPKHYSNNIQIFTASVQTVVSGLSAEAQLYAALVTRGYPQDVQALLPLLSRPRPCAYIGMIGSQQRVRRVLRAVETEHPLSQARLEAQPIHAPIGLDIGALTPAEIAVSIAAELVMVRRGGTGYPLTVVSGLGELL